MKPPRRNTRTHSQPGMFGGKAPLRLAAQKSRPHVPFAPMRCAPSYFICIWGVSSHDNTVPKAKSQAKDKRAKDRQKHSALRCKVGVAPPGFKVRRRMSRVAFRVFPAGRAGDTRAAICAV